MTHPPWHTLTGPRLAPDWAQVWQKYHEPWSDQTANSFPAGSTK